MLVQRVSVQGANGYVVRHEDKVLVFDVPSKTLDDKLEFPGPEEPSKCVQVLVPKALPRDVDAVFVSRSDFLGVFFLEFKGPLYMTQPVYEQLNRRIRALVDIGPLAIGASSAPEKYKQCGVSEYTRINLRTRIVSLNQSIRFALFEVRAQAAGTYLGWANYTLFSGRTALLCYSAGMRGDCSLAAEFVPPGRVPYLLVDQLYSEPPADVLGKFSEKIVHNLEKYGAAVVAVDLFLNSIEIVLHLLSLVPDVPVFVAHRAFFQLAALSELHPLFLCKSFRDRAYEGKPPLGLRASNRLNHVSPSELGQMLSGKQKDIPKLIVCDQMQVSLFPKISKYPGLVYAGAGEYNLKFFASFADVGEQSWFKKMLTSADNRGSENALFLEEGKMYKVSAEGLYYEIRLENTHLVQEICSKEDGVKLYLKGLLDAKGEGLVMKCESPSVMQAINESAETLLIMDDAVYLKRENGETARIGFKGPESVLLETIGGKAPSK